MREIQFLGFGLKKCAYVCVWCVREIHWWSNVMMMMMVMMSMVIMSVIWAIMRDLSPRTVRLLMQEPPWKKYFNVKTKSGQRQRILLMVIPSPVNQPFGMCGSMKQDGHTEPVCVCVRKSVCVYGYTLQVALFNWFNGSVKLIDKFQSLGIYLYHLLLIRQIHRHGFSCIKNKDELPIGRLNLRRIMPKSKLRHYKLNLKMQCFLLIWRKSNDLIDFSCRIIWVDDEDEMKEGEGLGDDTIADEQW